MGFLFCTMYDSTALVTLLGFFWRPGQLGFKEKKVAPRHPVFMCYIIGFLSGEFEQFKANTVSFFVGL